MHVFSLEGVEFRNSFHSELGAILSASTRLLGVLGQSLVLPPMAPDALGGVLGYAPGIEGSGVNLDRWVH